jgi:hypothetical protein
MSRIKGEEIKRCECVKTRYNKEKEDFDRIVDKNCYRCKGTGKIWVVYD